MNWTDIAITRAHSLFLIQVVGDSSSSLFFLGKAGIVVSSGIFILMESFFYSLVISGKISQTIPSIFLGSLTCLS